ncbi:MAG TPA: TetR family transcriptional regulator [Solirubrobacteraceae bacterium]|nr:TetR family transcriptional regulator [Solirubrobacteraceae bacterium]
MSRVYGGVQASERSATRRQQLLEAGLDLLGTDGWNATTVRAVCARARLTPRYFYESFADLDALLVAVFDSITDEVADAVLTAVTPPPGDAHATARAAIAAGLYVLTDDPRKGRVLFAEAIGSEALARRRRETLRGFAALVAAQGSAFYGVGKPDDRLVQLSATMLVGGLSEAFAAWLDGEVRATRERLIDDCAELFVAIGEAAVRLAAR